MRHSVTQGKVSTRHRQPTHRIAYRNEGPLVGGYSKEAPFIVPSFLSSGYFILPNDAVLYTSHIRRVSNIPFTLNTRGDDHNPCHLHTNKTVGILYHSTQYRHKSDNPPNIQIMNNINRILIISEIRVSKFITLHLICYILSLFMWKFIRLLYPDTPILGSGTCHFIHSPAFKGHTYTQGSRASRDALYILPMCG